MDVFPIEIIQQILQNLRPIIVPTPAKIDDPNVVTRNCRNWWAGQTARSYVQESNEPLHYGRKFAVYTQVSQNQAVRKDSVQGIQRTRYVDVLPLRL
jgi:hypothetical protein